MHLPEAYAHELNKYIESNPPTFKFDVLYFYYLAYHITTQQLRCKNGSSNYLEKHVPLNSKSFRSVCPTNIGYYIKFLVNGEFIICDNDYKIRVKSKGYIINPKYLEGIASVEISIGSRLFKMLVKSINKKKAHVNRLPEYLKQMRTEFMRMELDYEGAAKWVQNQTDSVKRNSYAISIQQLKDKRFRHFNRNSTNNRLDTNITNLKGDLRQFIIGDYVSIDLKNSQPFFLNQLILSIINTNINEGTLCCNLVGLDLVKVFGIKRIKAVLKLHHTDEKANLVNLRSFEASVNGGLLYDNFLKSYDGNLLRAEVKTIMFKVMFSSNELYKKEKQIFSSVFSYVYNAIYLLKDKEHKILPITLQKIESFTFIDCIAKDLAEANIMPFTIHDSVIVKTEHLNHSIQIIQKVFMERFGVIPTLDIKPLKDK